MMKWAASTLEKAARLLGRSTPRQEKAAARCSPQVLAYVGDAVFEVYIRTFLVGREGDKPVTSLHRSATFLARARGQAAFLKEIEPLLTEKEMGLVRRGRNAGGRIPKGAAMGDYRQATGLETLLGTLYLEGSVERLQEIMGAGLSLLLKDPTKGAGR